ALGLEELPTGPMPGSLFGDLTGAARHDVLVAFAAALRVVGRSETIGHCFDLLENETIVVERAERLDVVFVQRLVVRPLLVESIGLVAETGRGFERLARRAIVFVVDISVWVESRAARIIARIGPALPALTLQSQREERACGCKGRNKRRGDE